MSANKLELSKTVRHLREELLKAMEDGENQDLRFNMDRVELELNFTVDTQASAKGGVKFWVCNAETGGSVSSSLMQTVRLVLKPEIKGAKMAYLGTQGE